MNKLLIVILLLVYFNASSQTDENLVIADSLYALGDYNMAIRFYKKTRNSKFKIAKCYEASGNNVQALQYYKQTILANPDAIIAKYNYGKLFFKTGFYKSADSVFKLLRTAHPKNPNFPYYLGLIKEKQKDALAMEQFAIVLDLDSTHQNAIYKFAKNRTVKREFVEAFRYIKKGLSANPNSIRFLNLQALVFFHNKDYHGALSVYKKLLEYKQSNVQLHDNLAISFSKTNQFEKAINQYTILINEFDDENFKWHYQIANAYVALHYFAKAQRHLEIAIALKDISTEREYMSLSSIFRKTKDYQAQLDALKKVIAQNPKNQVAHYFIATAADNYFKDKNMVIPYYERYLKRFGDNGKFNEYAKQRIKDLKTELHFSKD